MNFLIKVAQILSTATQFLSGFHAVPKPLVVADDTLDAIIGLVVQIETIGGQPGVTVPNKALTITPLVSQVILNSPFMANKKIDDKAKFQAAITTITGGIADLLSSLHGDAVSGQQK